MPDSASVAAVHVTLTVVLHDCTPTACVVDARLVTAVGGAPSTVTNNACVLSTQLSERALTIQGWTPSTYHRVVQRALRLVPGRMSPSSTSRPSCGLPIKSVTEPSSRVVDDAWRTSPLEVESRYTAEAMKLGLLAVAVIATFSNGCA